MERTVEKNKWTREKCFEFAKKYNSRTQLRNANGYVCNKAIKNGWIDDYTWFIQNYKQEIKWTEEACYKAAQKCSNVTEFRETYYGAYSRSKKYGWIEQYTWFKDGRRDIHKKVYVIYAYEDTVNKSVYIGLTNNIKRRTMEHKKKDYKHTFRKYDRVREYFDEHNMNIPVPIVLIDGIDGIEAQEKERLYIEEYVKKGWAVINISKTGKNSSSLGNVGVKWTYEKCAEVAATCRNRTELRTKYCGAMDAITNNGWIELLPTKREYCTFTKEECIEYCKNIETVNELKKINMNIFRRIKNKSWISVCFPKKMYTEIECRNIARQYKNFSEIKRSDSTLAYSINKLAITNIEFKKEKEVEYSFEEMKKLCSNYSNRTDFSRRNHKAYKYCVKMRWIDELLPSSIKIFTLEESIEEAKKYNSRDKFRTERRSAYYKLKKADLLDKLLPKQKPIPPKRNSISYEKKYLEMAAQCSTINEFRKKFNNAYRYCKKHKILDKTNLPKEIKQPTITRDDCYKAASKCTFKREFRTNYPKEYHASSAIHHMLKDFTWLKGCKKEYSEKDCYSAAIKCTTKKEFREKYPKEYKAAKLYDILKNFTWL